ncbi:MAG: Glycosyl transferase group 1 [Microgenomates bacterium OLB22]|nr:MAG: Glycosyl transferase group 1 [Microgenomates bacterium OLB22]
MHLLADAGSLTAHKYGTGIVTHEILKTWINHGDTIVGYAHEHQDDLPAIFWKQTSGILWKPSLMIEGLIGHYDGFLALNHYIPPFAPGKIIALSHGLSFMRYPRLYPEAYSMLRSQMQRIAQDAHVIMTSSAKVKREWKKYTGRREGILSVPFGIPTDLKSIHAQKNAHPVPYLLYVGMDHPIKRISRIVKAFAQVYRSNSNCHLILAGVSRDRWRHPGVVVIPYADRKRLVQLYKGAHALVSMSAYESGNLPVIESLSLGCPVIATSTAIIPELRGYVTIVDSSHMVDHLRVCLAAPRDTVSLRLRRELAAVCSWETMVSQIRNTMI